MGADCPRCAGECQRPNWTNGREKAPAGGAFCCFLRCPDMLSDRSLEEREGFEPSVRFRTPDFESGTFDHSATSPWLDSVTLRSRSLIRTGLSHRSLVGRIIVVGAAKPAILQDFFCLCKEGVGKIPTTGFNGLSAPAIFAQNLDMPVSRRWLFFLFRRFPQGFSRPWT